MAWVTGWADSEDSEPESEPEPAHSRTAGVTIQYTTVVILGGTRDTSYMRKVVQAKPTGGDFDIRYVHY
jgi:hypothetical protein